MTNYVPEVFAGGDHESDMPSFEDVLSDNEILTVLAFSKSTWSGETRARYDEMNVKALQGKKP